MRRSDDELDRLAELLAAIPQDQLPMTLGEFDGFATGILACPELIPTSEWLPPVWGDTGDAGFPDIGAAQATVTAVMAHYNAIASTIAKSPWIEPIYETDPNSGELLWEPWVDGFSRAMRLRPETWQSVFDQADDDTRASMIFLMALQDIYEGNSTFSDDDIDEIDQQAPELIPNCVAEILLLTRPELIVRGANTAHAPARPKTPGRNDPCPCGSGRKYKKCCGSN